MHSDSAFAFADVHFLLPLPAAATDVLAAVLTFAQAITGLRG